MKVSAALLLAVATTVHAIPASLYEKDFDFYGNDIGIFFVNPIEATPEANLDKCFAQCTGGSWPACKAVTFYQGKCFFKSIQGEATRLDGAISSGVYDDITTVKNGLCPLKVEENVDYVDNDIGNEGGRSDECCEKCRKTKGCRAYSWSNHQGGTCWFKSKRGATTAKDGVYSAIVYPPLGPVVNFEYNTDYVDHDIGNRPSGTADGCVGICKTFPGCNAFTWSDFNRGTCWLKAGKDATVYKNGVVSAVVNPTTPKCDALQDSVDIYNNDLANTVGIPNVNDCPSICKATTNCKGFTWSDYMGGTCWLKSHTPPDAGVSTVPKFGVKSCFKII